MHDNNVGPTSNIETPVGLGISVEIPPELRRRTEKALDALCLAGFEVAPLNSGDWDISIPD